MPNPKRRHSKQRKRLRRTHYKAKSVNMSVCTNCKSMILPHRVCPQCGYYKGRMVVQLKQEEGEKKK